MLARDSKERFYNCISSNARPGIIIIVVVVSSNPDFFAAREKRLRNCLSLDPAVCFQIKRGTYHPKSVFPIETSSIVLKEIITTPDFGGSL